MAKNMALKQVTNPVQLPRGSPPPKPMQPDHGSVTVKFLKSEPLGIVLKRAHDYGAIVAKVNTHHTAL